MDIVYPVRVEFLALLRRPLHAQRPGIVVGLAFHHLPGQCLGDVAVEGLRHHRQLREFRKRLDAGDDGDGDAHRPCLLHKGEVFLVVVEQLGHGILRAQVLLLLQILHVHLQVRCLLVLLGIAGHAVVKRLAGSLDGCTVGEETLVEAFHLPHQVRRVGMSPGRRNEAAVLLRLVATQQQQVADAQELQVKQLIFDVLYRCTAADHVGLHGDVVPLLDGCGYRHRPRATADALPLKLSVLQFAVHELRVVGGDVDIGGVELPQPVDVGEELLRARPLQRGQHFKREPSCRLILMDKFRNTHCQLCINRCKITKNPCNPCIPCQKIIIFVAKWWISNVF